ncbi:MAG TPA: bifunctional ADP-heptose synthase [Bacteroidales bacterium]|nr:bifunctional ADP-heptose synthase [Bacteroidales bacterium]HPS17967.1 bifunctional ADP-heptose synthase [Bacteroidales bacterium]
MDITNNKINELFNNFSSQTIMVIGDVMIDSYLWGKVERISPEAPVPIVSVNKRENRLGGAANVALNLLSLGATPILCSVVGTDQKGNDFYEMLESLHLTGKGIIACDDRVTTTKFRVIGNNAQMLRVDEETENNISEKDEEKLIKSIRDIIKNNKINAIIFEDYDKGVITAKVIQETVKTAKEHSIPVIADPKRKNFNEYKNITLFKPNLKELKEGTKSDIIKSQSEIDNAVEVLHKNNNIEMIMVTLSDAGMYISVKDKAVGKTIFKKLIPAHIRNIADVSGAGDTVISVASLCLALKQEPEIIASISNLAGGLVCEYVGVVPVNKEKLLKEALQMER